MFSHALIILLLVPSIATATTTTTNTTTAPGTTTTTTVAATSTTTAIGNTTKAASTTSIALIDGFLPLDSYSTAAWGTTLDISGKQRMLSQKMAKEFLFVAHGDDVAANKAKTLATVNTFSVNLLALVNGDAERSIIGSPTIEVKVAFDAVVSLWATVKAIYVDNLDTVRDVNGGLNQYVLGEVMTQSLALLKASANAVKMLVDAEKQATGKAAKLAVDLFGRQRMLLQKMSKEALLMAVDTELEANRANLKNTIALYFTTHRGLVEGAAWAGIPVMSDYCAIQQMAKVSFSWYKFKQVLDAVVGEHGRGAQVLASQSSADIEEYGTACFKDTVKGVSVYRSENNQCDARADLTSKDWIYLIDAVDVQATLGQEASVLFMQVANEVSAELTQASKVDMIRVMANFDIIIRGLIEGNLANNIPPPPTQKIADDLISGYSTWTTLQTELQIVVNLAHGSSVDRVMVQTIVQLSARLLSEVQQAAHLLLVEAKTFAAEVEPYTIEVAGRQRMLQQQVAKEAHIIRNYATHDEDNTNEWHTLRSSIALWKSTHHALLKGDPATNISSATSLCLIWAMKYAKDDFDVVEKGALGVASAGDAEANEMILELANALPRGFVSMNKVVGYYQETDKSEMEKKCTAETTWTMTEEGWKAAIMESGVAAAQAQKLVSEALLFKYGQSFSARPAAAAAAAASPAPGPPIALSALDTKIEEMTTCLDKLKFGSGIVPPPMDDDFLTIASALHDTWPSFATALHGISVERRLAGAKRRIARRLAGAAAPAPAQVANVKSSVPELLEKEKTTSTQSVAFMDKLVLASSLGVPGNRMRLVNRQLMLVNQMVKEALLLKYGFSGTNTDSLNAASGQFLGLMETLETGGDGIPELIKQREDLKARIESVTNLFAGFEAKVSVVASSSAHSADGLDEMNEGLDNMEVELNLLSADCAQEDPFVPALFEWTRVIYLGMVLPAFTLVVCSGVYKGWVPRDD